MLNFVSYLLKVFPYYLFSHPPQFSPIRLFKPNISQMIPWASYSPHMFPLSFPPPPLYTLKISWPPPLYYTPLIYHFNKLSHTQHMQSPTTDDVMAPISPPICFHRHLFPHYLLTHLTCFGPNPPTQPIISNLNPLVQNQAQKIDQPLPPTYNYPKDKLISVPTYASALNSNKPIKKSLLKS